MDSRIAVFPGDGIGTEITEPTVRLFDKVAARVGGISFTTEHCDAGTAYYLDHGTALPEESLKTTRQLDLRMEFGLYAGVRHVKPIAGVRAILADTRARKVDYIILRESTAGWFARQAPGTMPRPSWYSTAFAAALPVGGTDV